MSSIKYAVVEDGVLTSSSIDKLSVGYFLKYKDTFIPLHNGGVIIDGDDYIYNGKRYRISNCELYDAVSNAIENDGNSIANYLNGLVIPKVHTNNIMDRLPNPDTNGIQPFLKIVLKAVFRYGKTLPLSPNQRARQNQLYRHINKLHKTGTEISVQKAVELLNTNGLTLSDIIKDEFTD